MKNPIFFSFLLSAFCFSAAAAPKWQNSCPGLIAWWPCANGSGTNLTDYAGNNSGHTVANSGITWSSGVVNGAVNYAASNGYTTGAFTLTTNLAPTTGLTVTAWIWPTAYSHANSAIFSKNSSPGGSSYIDMYLLSTDNLYAVVDAAANCNYTGTHSVPTNGWTFAAFTFTNSPSNVIQGYFNGIADGTTVKSFTTAMATSATATNYIGNDIIYSTSGAPRTFVGTIGEVRIYNRALAQWEIQELYGGGYGCAHP